MRKTTILILMLLPFLVFSQEYQKIDSKVREYPSYINLNILSQRISNDFDSDEEKVRAIYSWLAYNINYYTDKSTIVNSSIEMYFSEYDRERKQKNKEAKQIEETISKKRANCYGFSLTFQKLCDLLNIESEVIIGYAKADINDIGAKKSFKNHAWNAVKINNKWKFIDATWANTYLSLKNKKFLKDFYNYYFFTDPDELITSHFPANSKWQLTSNYISKKQFFSKPFLHPNYFVSNFKLTDMKGVLKVSKKTKHVIINFDKINNKDKEYSYTYTGDKHASKLEIIEQYDSTYRAKIKSPKKENSNLTLFYKSYPIVSFKVNTID
ncbi:hypothetical protein D7030_12840 [Flavobacteriaceae bacterium AU392]|nr:hypothetical protein D1817_05650 [Flavobacteriaceae bacterium]RKM81192.1 hypothetical protein D7030_12840 [Flavobacteriaceae bacterium AU392]